MRPIVMLLLGLLFAALVVMGCSGDEREERQAEEQAQTVSVEQQADAAKQETQSPAPEQSTGQDQTEQVADTADQGQQQHADQPDQPDQAEPAQSEQQDQQHAQQQAQPEEETKLVIGVDRPATLLLPKGADRAEPRLLIVLLHGYGSNAAEADGYFRFSSEVDKRGFGLLLPNGTQDRNIARFWNGTPECCDIFGAETDDVGYIKSLIDEARTIAAFDQVFAVGHSNGGFMAYRLACEDVEGLTAIVSLAGGAHSDGAECRVPTPLSVLQIHGTEDALVLYEGGRLPTHPDPHRRPVPSAKGSVLRWAERAGCDIEAAEKRPPIDTDSAVEGDETTVWRWSSECADGVVTELWTIEEGGHVPIVWDTQFTEGILKWLTERYEGLGAADESLSEIEQRTIGGERMVSLMFPADRGAEPIPLVVSLHGYGSDAQAQDWFFGLSDRILQYHFALITPQGTVDQAGNQFWNGADGCCDFYGSGFDDYAWITSLVEEAQETVNISGVYVVGYSNGGFMAYRLACDGLDGLVAIASLAGSSYGDLERCEDAGPISLLQIHGTDDMQIPYAGTLEYAGGYPGAVELVDRWAGRADCRDASAEALANIDLERAIDGSETSVERRRAGCSDGITIELWTIEGGNHFPDFHEDWPDHLLNWLFNDSRTN
ncbi:MAG: hypothetical protein OXD50_05790 [Chloroflexi bacterium]|nr:hypothetical protein [Chloroflexota bacterium]